MGHPGDRAGETAQRSRHCTRRPTSHSVAAEKATSMPTSSQSRPVTGPNTTWRIAEAA